jgi:hypothetical protein
MRDLKLIAESYASMYEREVIEKEFPATFFDDSFDREPVGNVTLFIQVEPGSKGTYDSPGSSAYGTLMAVEDDDGPLEIVRDHDYFERLVDDIVSDEGDKERPYDEPVD